MDIYKEFGQRLATFRQKQNLSQKQLAEQLSMPQSTYAGYESGSRKIPLEQIVALSNVFHVSPTVLILGKEAIEIDNFSSHEIALIKKYRALDERGKKAVDDTANSQLESMEPVAADEVSDVKAG